MATSKINVEIVAGSPKSNLGEGPHWDTETQSLYYVDIYGQEYTILRYDYAENRIYGATIDSEPVVSFIIPIVGATNQFAVGVGRRVGIIQWDGKSSKATVLRYALEVEQEDKCKSNRFNDGKADPLNRLYGGTMHVETDDGLLVNGCGSFYSYSKDRGLVKYFDGVSCSNGLAWDMKKNKFYYIDSWLHNVRSFDYDSKTGAITNEQVAIDLKVNGNDPGYFPDGMTIDADGNLYVATWDGSKIIKVNPSTKEIITEVLLPCDQITSAAFGGPNLDILYVTSAATDRKRPQSKDAGYLFKITGFGVGLPMQKVRL